MKVIKDFFCIQTKTTYKVGDEYNGKRKDLKGFLEVKKQNKKAPATKKGAIEKK
jgi:hypothetical protein